MLLKQVKMDAQPEGGALGGTDDGQWFATDTLRVTETLSWLSLLQRTSADMLFAPGSRYQPWPRSYGSCEEAIASYCAWLEEAGLVVYWRALAAHIEVYPERNVWYLEEILHLVGAIPLVGVGVADAYAIVIAGDRGRSYLLDAIGTSPDEAIEALYQRVYDYLYGWQEEVHHCAS